MRESIAKEWNSRTWDLHVFDGKVITSLVWISFQNTKNTFIGIRQISYWHAIRSARKVCHYSFFSDQTSTERRSSTCSSWTRHSDVFLCQRVLCQCQTVRVEVSTRFASELCVYKHFTNNAFQVRLYVSLLVTIPGLEG